MPIGHGVQLRVLEDRATREPLVRSRRAACLRDGLAPVPVFGVAAFALLERGAETAGNGSPRIAHAGHGARHPQLDAKPRAGAGGCSRHPGLGHQRHHSPSDGAATARPVAASAPARAGPRRRPLSCSCRFRPRVRRNSAKNPKLERSGARAPTAFRAGIRYSWLHAPLLPRVHHGSTSAHACGGHASTPSPCETTGCRDFSTAYARPGPLFTRRSTTHNREAVVRIHPEPHRGKLLPMPRCAFFDGGPPAVSSVREAVALAVIE
jgi:hypothetical protein